MKGDFPLYPIIMGSGNTISGNGFISGVITLLNSSSEITIDLNGIIKNIYQALGKII